MKSFCANRAALLKHMGWLLELLLAVALLSLTLSSCKKHDDVITSTITTGTPLIPETQTYYTVVITGTTYFGNTNFPTAQTKYTPEQTFRLTGRLYVDKGYAGHDRDVALIVGNPAGSPIAGSIWFASNTRAYAMPGFGSSSVVNASLDIGPVTIDEKAGTIQVDATDQNVTRSSLLNSYNVRSGLLANVYQILFGTMKLTFVKNGSVKGEFVFNGNGYIEPSSTAIVATIEGQKQ